jgi:xylulokinase
MADEAVLLTFDIGTTGNKCSLFSSDGRTLASVTVPYPTCYVRPGWAEQEPEDYWRSTAAGTKLLGERYPEYLKRVVGIGLSGHMNGMLPVDGAGQPLYREIIHADSRSEPQCRYIRERIAEDEFFRITGNRIDSHLSLSKVLWFRDEYPDLYRKTAAVLQSKDFIVGRLVGRMGTTDLSDASLTCALDISGKHWSSELLQEVGLELEKFPVILRSHDIVGELCTEAAQLLGLPAGLPVTAGGGDAACSTRGAGINDYTTAMNCIGSSSWISLLAAEPLLDAGMRIQNFYDIDGESCTICGTVQSAGSVVDWMADVLAKIEDVPGMDDSVRYQHLEQLASLSPPGANGMLLLPYFMGERTPHWNQDLKGSFVGLTPGHTRSDMARAVYEGVGFALRDVLQVFAENNLPVNELVLTGGGALSPFWNQLLSSLFSLPITIPSDPKQATSLGAATAAMVGLGMYRSYAEAAGARQYPVRFSPASAEAQAYDTLFSRYQAVYPAYAALCAALNI